MAIERHNTNIKIGLDWIWVNCVENEIKTMETIMLPKIKEGVKLALGSLSYNNFRGYLNAEFIGRDVNVSYTLLYYSNLFGFSSYKTDYNTPFDILIEMRSRSRPDENFQGSLRMTKLLGHYLLNYIKTAILLRDSEAKAFYASIEPRTSIPDNHIYQLYEQDLEQLLILLCGKDEDKIITHLQKIQSFDYLGFLKTTRYQTSFSVPIIEHLLVPSVEVLLSIFEDKKEIFNEVLEKALLQHKAYYEADDEYNESRRGKPEGWVSLLLTCACAIAHDKGIKREVASDYIPEWLVKGDFEGLELVVE